MKGGEKYAVLYDVRAVLQLLHDLVNDKEGEDGRTQVGDGLSHLQAQQTEDPGKDQQRGDQEDALTRNGNERGLHAQTHGLGAHVAQGNERPQGQGE